MKTLFVGKWYKQKRDESVYAGKICKNIVAISLKRIQVLTGKKTKIHVLTH